MAIEFIHAVGRRKSSVARVYIKPGKGDVIINERTLDEYFGELHTKNKVYKPLEVTGNKGKIDVQANVHGGGPTGQIDAISHGISRALVKLSAELRPSLKKEGLLTRDSRIKERKKYGQRGARARYQYSKR
jgi:small subunit ribosomal protein S9